MKRSIALTGALLVFGIIAVLHYLPSRQNDLSSELPLDDSALVLSAAGGASYYDMLRRNAVTGQVEQADLIRGQKLALLGSNRKASLGLTWSEMGPDNAGGRTRAILIVDGHPNQVYAGGVSGGLWYSSNGGTTWSRVSGLFDNLAVSSIARTANGHLYVATGNHHERPSTQEGSGFIGKGLYVSTDAGASFSVVPGTEPAINGVNSAWTEINELAVDPTEVNKVWIGGNGPDGLYSFHPNFGLTAHPILGNVEDVKFTLAGGQSTLIVAASTAGVRTHVSHDNGASFIEVSGNGLTEIPFGGVTRIEYAISPDDANWVYASVVTGSGGVLKGIYQSLDGGLTWVAISPASTASFDPFVHPSGASNQGFYDNAITVVPGNRRKILVGGITLWGWEQVSSSPSVGQWEQIAAQGRQCGYCVHSDIHAFEWDENGWLLIGTDGGIYKTADRVNYLPFNRGFNVSQFYGLAYSREGKVLGGTQDNGMIYLNQTGATWREGLFVPLSVAADGFSAEISHIDPDIMFGTGQYGFVERSEDGGVSWGSFYDTNILALGGGLSDLGPFKTMIRMHEQSMDVHSEDSIVLIADDDYFIGDTIFYTSATADQELIYEVTSTIFEDDSVMLVDPVQSVFALGLYGNEGVWITRDAMRFSASAEWWQVLDGSITTDFANDAVHTMEFSNDGDHLFIGTYEGDVYRVSGLNSCYSAEQADPTDPAYALSVTQLRNGNGSSVVTGIAADPQNVEHLVVTMGGFSETNVLESNTAISDNGNIGFVSIEGDLPDFPVYSCMIDRADANNIVIGTEYGVYASDDGGTTWTPENANMERVPVFEIRQQWRTWADGAVNSGVIYIATHGRGIWRSETLVSDETVEDPTLSETAGVLSVELYPNPVSTSTTIEFTMQQTADVQLSVYDLTGKVVQEQQLSNLRSGQQKLTIQAAGLAVGTYLVHLETPSGVGTARMVVQR
jgi:photosystem II stability/assembly factor-like uncharacterized protein